MPAWLLELEAGLMLLNALTPAIQALIQEIIANQGGQPTAAQTALLLSAHWNAIVRAQMGQAPGLGALNG